MNLFDEANRLYGYLLATSGLKADGTFFDCVFLGEGGPDKQLAEAERRFQFRAGTVELTALANALTPENIPKTFEGWLLNRIRPSDEDSPMDARLVSGVASELAGIFGRAPEWFQVRQIIQANPMTHLGAFWSIYIFGREVGSCAILCSWDS
jgi:hypothetical protein